MARASNQTPIVAPAQVDDKTHTASFRINLPLSTVGIGRYTVQAVVVEAGGASSFWTQLLRSPGERG